MKFVHLHLHTENSILDGASKLTDLFSKIVRDQAAVSEDKYIQLLAQDKKISCLFEKLNDEYYFSFKRVVTIVDDLVYFINQENSQYQIFKEDQEILRIKDPNELDQQRGHGLLQEKEISKLMGLFKRLGEINPVLKNIESLQLNDQLKDNLKKLLQQSYNQPAVAITDHGVMHGAVDFYIMAKEQAGIKPIIGCEAYVARRTRFDKQPKLDEKPFHLTLLVKNEIGYKNLVQLVSAAWKEGFYYKPRIDRQLLEKHHEGLIALSGCMFGEVSSAIRENKYQEAIAVAKWYQNLFQDDYYLEIQDHGFSEQKTINQQMLKISSELNIPMVATNDSHYINAEDSIIQDILICINTGRLLSDDNRMKMSTNQTYVKSYDEMCQTFNNQPEVIGVTAEIADKCDFCFDFDSQYLPFIDVPQGYDLDSYLKFCVYEGLKKLYPQLSPEVCQRADYELEVIKKMGYSAYFLIVADFIAWARKNDIMVGPGRGSAGGSIISYALQISTIDPLKYDLLFERFLNPERVTMPDIDVDFCVRGRDKVIEYVADKYGRDNVSQIITYTTMAAKMVIRDVGRVTGVPLPKVNTIAKLIPTRPGITIKKAMEEEPELKLLYENDPEVKALIDKAKKLEGLTRGVGTHASGVVISKLPLHEIVPMEVVRDSASKQESLVTQYTMTNVEKLGLLKMDFLGLRNLTIIADTLKTIKQTKNIDLDINKIPLDDRDTFKIYQYGETMGVFQSESDGIRKLMRKLKPSVFEDVVALVALYRPGPLGSGMVEQFVDRKHGRAPIVYALPQLEEILKDTYGLILYQEQVMLISQKIGGFSMADADKLRKAMGKKIVDLMNMFKEKFISGAIEKGIDKRIAAGIYDQCAEFAKYGFNKSHSVAYGYLSYQTAYLKAHYPLEFLAAVLDSVATDDISENNQKTKAKNMDKVAEYLHEAERIGIKVLPPSVNESEYRFAPVKGSIRFGLGAIKNLSSQLAYNIVKERKAGGEFLSFREFCERISDQGTNKKSMESLILAGALDIFGSRQAMLAEMPTIMADVQKKNSRASNGEVSLFEMIENSQSQKYDPDEFYGKADFSDQEKLLKEKDYLGLFVSDHPLKHVPNLRDYARQKIADYLFEVEQDTEEIDNLDNLVEEDIFDEPLVIDDFKETQLAGMFSSISHITTKSGKKMARGFFEDLSGQIAFLVFPNVYEKIKQSLITEIEINGEKKPFFVVVQGEVSKDDDETILKISDVKKLPESNSKVAALNIELNYDFDQKFLDDLKSLLVRHKGLSPVYITVDDKKIKLGDNFKVTINQDSKDSIEQLVGKGLVWEN